jgi:hypothetical protein
MPIALTISRRMLIQTVLSTVDFDDELLAQADEIQNVTVSRSLSAEMVAAIPPGAQMHPTLYFLGRE